MLLVNQPTGHWSILSATLLLSDATKYCLNTGIVEIPKFLEAHVLLYMGCATISVTVTNSDVPVAVNTKQMSSEPQSRVLPPFY